MKKYLVLSLLILTVVSAGLFAQNYSGLPNSTPVQSMTPYYTLIPISATAAVNNQTTLTIPAPAAGLFNYVCWLNYHASQDGTATAQTNAVTTSTNFNSYALKYSLTATATINYDETAFWGNPATGCVKSDKPGTATTFVSPAAAANLAFTWKATYYQAP